MTGNIFRSGPETNAVLDRQHLPLSQYKNTHLRILILIIPSTEMLFSIRKNLRSKGTTGVHLTCTLYPSHQTKNSFLFLTIRPRFVGRAARPRAATLPRKRLSQLCIRQSWRPLRSSSGDCGARADGTGSAGCAGRRRIVAALGRGSLLWAPTKRGREHQSRTTRRSAAPGYGPRRI